jgi:hypothetical protein
VEDVADAGSGAEDVAFHGESRAGFRDAGLGTEDVADADVGRDRGASHGWKARDGRTVHQNL